MATQSPVADLAVGLSEFEARLLNRICRDGPYESIIDLAADEWQFSDGSSVGNHTVYWCVSHLCELGLVRMRLREYVRPDKRYGEPIRPRGLGDAARLDRITEAYDEGAWAWVSRAIQSGAPDQFMLVSHVAAERAAYELLNYPVPMRVVGAKAHPLSERPANRMDDVTDFRNWRSFKTIGGPIERMPLEDHLILYPEHRAIHPTAAQLAAELGKEHIVSTPGQHQTPVTRADALRWRDRFKSTTIAEIARSEGRSKATVTNYVTGVYRDKFQPETVSVVADEPENETLKSAMLTAIAKEGSFPDVRSLMAYLRRETNSGGNYGAHEVTHLIYSLQKQSYVKFITKRVGREELLTKIKPTPAGMRAAGFGKAQPDTWMPTAVLDKRHPVGTDYTDPKAHPARANGGPIERSYTEPAVDATPPAPPMPAEPTPEPYPLLAGLRARFEATAAARAKAEALISAAALLEGVGDEQQIVEALTARAEQVASDSKLSPLEEEFLRYANEHP